jgi:hypothetical protein
VTAKTYGGARPNTGRKVWDFSEEDMLRFTRLYRNASQCARSVGCSPGVLSRLAKQYGLDFGRLA